MKVTNEIKPIYYLERTKFYDEATIGRIFRYPTSEEIDFGADPNEEREMCKTLEPKWVDARFYMRKNKRNTCIPAGIYPLYMEYDIWRKFLCPRIGKTPGYRNVRICVERKGGQFMWDTSSDVLCGLEWDEENCQLLGGPEAFRDLRSDMTTQLGQQKRLAIEILHVVPDVLIHAPIEKCWPEGGRVDEDDFMLHLED